ncbi:unnamed protein product [Adineta ricciae]|uniref:G domain-containing protein n=1 Tax=Adineta ricciae TaxID=249248 RepID=A0A813TH17_ADIRI|nr:unnamed protein product [Adineta ricciae]CAF0811574.1 unnamed protein product [Adineta ricciae]
MPDMTSGVDKTSTEINVIIFGETGSGKSTLINYLTNLFHNGSLTNLKVSIPTQYLQSNVAEHCTNDIACHPTDHCRKYQYKVKGVYFNFYDTSGYSVENDNLEKIFQCLKVLDHLTALVLVANGTQARLTINIKPILQRFHEYIPDIFHKNLIVILTHCTSHTVNFDTVKFFQHVPRFYMQNSAFSSDPQAWSRQTLDILEYDWTRGIDTMNEFIKCLLLLTPIATRCLIEMQRDRDTIRSILHESRLTMIELQSIEDELITLEETSRIHSVNLQKQTTQTKTIQVNEIVFTPYHNTLCLQCNTVCHERCSLMETTQIGANAFRRCTVMNSGRCTRCVGHCSSDMHYHDCRLIKPVSRTLKYTIPTLSNDSTEEKCRTIQQTKDLLEQLLQNQIEKIRKTCLHLKTHCQSFNLVEELYTFIQLLNNDLIAIKSTSAIERTRKVIKELQLLANGNSPMRSSSSTSKYAKCTTEQLIDITGRLLKKHFMMIDELHQRCQGNSICYLSSAQLLTLCEYYRSSQQLDIEKLTTLRSKLQSEIEQLTHSNPLKILSVPVDKLLHLTAIRLCLQHINVHDEEVNLLDIFSHRDYKRTDQ